MELKPNRAERFKLEHQWIVQIDGHILNENSAEYQKALELISKAVEDKDWTPKDSVTVRVNRLDVIYEFWKNGKRQRTEKRNLLKTCRLKKAKAICPSNYGAIVIPNL